jgi:hypothetical protein
MPTMKLVIEFQSHEAKSLLRTLGFRFGLVEELDNPAQPDLPESEPIPRIIEMMAGRPSGRVLSLLAKSRNLSMTDKQIRDEYGKKINIGAAMCHVTRCCKKCGINRTDIVEIEHHGIGARKVVTYTLSEAAQIAMLTVPDIGTLGPDYLD